VKILIVDDDVVSRMVLMHLIDDALKGRCEVLEAEDGEDAWRQLQTGAAGGSLPAMLFCDLRMPRLSGMELLARVKADARFAALPFVLASAAGDAATMEQALGLGAHGYIVKPAPTARTRPASAPRRPHSGSASASSACWSTSAASSASWTRPVPTSTRCWPAASRKRPRPCCTSWPRAAARSAWTAPPRPSRRRACRQARGRATRA
jgi:CheY-like chemotaxis protein